MGLRVRFGGLGDLRFVEPADDDGGDVEPVRGIRPNEHAIDVP